MLTRVFKTAKMIISHFDIQISAWLHRLKTKNRLPRVKTVFLIFLNALEALVFAYAPEIIIGMGPFREFFSPF